MSYKLTHPDSDQTIEVSKEAVALYESQGWETAPTAKAPAADK
jgi:hypothetical protein